jgi:hypothetical protein
MTPFEPPVDWKSVAFMGALFTIQCGAILAISKLVTNQEKPRERS